MDEVFADPQVQTLVWPLTCATSLRAMQVVSQLVALGRTSSRMRCATPEGAGTRIRC